MADRVGQQFGNYRLVRLLGQGGFADVYLAEHIHLETQAAVKVLSMQLTSEHVEHFRTEARTIARLLHPNIVRVLDFGVEDNTPYLAMDYAPNGSLRQHYPKGTRLPLATIIDYVKQVAAALQYAHERKLVHRDIKPENMLLGEDQQVLLSDFGIALVTQSTRYQNTQEVIGTAAYMAPEQLQGKPRRASDQYSLGIVVYEWICGDRPFHGSFTEIYSQQMFVPPPPLYEKIPTIPHDVEQVVFTALAKDPSQRFASIQAFAKALEQANQAASFAHPISPISESPFPSQSSQSNEIPTALPSSQLSELPVMAASPIPKEAPSATPLEEPVSKSNLPRHGKTTSVPKPTSNIAIVNHRQGRFVSRTVLLIGLALILIGSLGLFSIIRTNQIATDNTSATATAQMNATNTANAATRIMAQANTTTAMAQANTAATITVTTLNHTYVQATSGTPVLNDPLIDNSRGYNWTEGTILVSATNIGTCTFSEGAYHLIPYKGYFIFCGPRGSFSDFAFQVQMKIIKGDAGGIGFRWNSNAGYFFYITPEGSYTLFSYDPNSHTSTTLKDGLSLAIRTGLNQSNLIAVLAQGNTITLYVNNQYIGSVVNNTYNKGFVGVSASAFVNLTEVVFSNARLWIV